MILRSGVHKSRDASRPSGTIFHLILSATLLQFPPYTKNAYHCTSTKYKAPDSDGVTGHSETVGLIMKIASFHLSDDKNLKVTSRFLLVNM